MNTHEPGQLLRELKDNLTAQRQAMFADDLAALSQLTNTQQGLLDALHSSRVKTYFCSNEVSAEDAELLDQVLELLRTNELLARQSLSYARRMLEALDGRGGGQVSPGMGLDRKV